MLDSPLIISEIDGLDVEVIGTVHTLYRVAALAVKEIKRFDPDHICVELKAPGQPTDSFEILEARSLYPDRIIAIDRPIDVTISRYLSGTPPGQFFLESLIKFFFILPNALSIIAFNRSPWLYRAIAGGGFYTFGWSWNDKKMFIFERDEYMAAQVASLLREDRNEGKRMRYAMLVGRRHVPGIASILEAYRYMGDIGSYYAGGNVYDVFSLRELEEPYTLDYATSSKRFTMNRAIEGIMKAIFLPLYMLLLFALMIAIAFIAAAIVYMILKRF